MEDQQLTEHDFNEKERAFFAEQIGQTNALIAAIQAAANLVRVQNGLEGNWRLKADGTGLEKV